MQKLSRGRVPTRKDLPRRRVDLHIRKYTKVKKPYGDDGACVSVAGRKNFQSATTIRMEIAEKWKWSVRMGKVFICLLYRVYDTRSVGGVRKNDRCLTVQLRWMLFSSSTLVLHPRVFFIFIL